MDKIIVSLTSWKGRINKVCDVIKLMKSQTLKPDQIILNLASAEFKNLEDDLPKDLLSELDFQFEINWVLNDTKVYKKIIPTLLRFPNDIVIGIDDDIKYPLNYIEILYKSFIDNGSKNPIASCKVTEKPYELYRHSGAFSLTKSEFYGSYLRDLYGNVVLKYGIDKIIASDEIFFYAAALNGIKYKLCKPLLATTLKLYAESQKLGGGYSMGYNKEWWEKYRNQRKLIHEYIESKYGKSYDDLMIELSKK